MCRKLGVPRSLIYYKKKYKVCKMIEGTALDVYIVTLYVVSQKFKEKNNLSPFKMDMECLLFELQKALISNKEEFQNGIIYSNSLDKKAVWDEIKRLNDLCKEEYDILLL